MLVVFLHKMFDYLNKQTYLKNTKRYLGVTALEIFNKVFFGEVKDIFLREVLDNFNSYRNGGVVDENLLKDAVECFVIQGQGL